MPELEPLRLKRTRGGSSITRSIYRSQGLPRRTFRLKICRLHTEPRGVTSPIGSMVPSSEHCEERAPLSSKRSRGSSTVTCAAFRLVRPARGHFGIWRCRLPAKPREADRTTGGGGRGGGGGGRRGGRAARARGAV